MEDDELLRYSRQIMLPEFGIEGQQRLNCARALIIGLGGLGSPAAMYLAAAGVGTLELADDDQVDLSNLQRQVLHSTSHIGMAKTRSAELALQALNPATGLVLRDTRLQGAALRSAVEAADVVLDCSDNFATRFALNEICHALHTPLVSGAAIRWDGQITVFEGRPGGPCYRCLYTEDGEEELRCSENGVIAPLVGIIGAMQAIEAIKLLCGIGESLGGRLLMLDALRLQWRELRLRADPRLPGMWAMILFIHGFGSCGWGEKSLQLRRHFGVDRVLAPDLPFHPDRAMDTLQGLLRRYPVDALVGSSLGGFFATCLNAAARLPGVLINPVVRPHELLADHLGAQRRWCDDAPFRVETDFLPALARLQREQLAADERYLVLLQQGDEVLDYRRAEKFYAGKDVVSLPGGSHRFEGFENHLPRIADWLRLSDEHHDKDHQTTA